MDMLSKVNMQLLDNGSSHIVLPGGGKAFAHLCGQTRWVVALGEGVEQKSIYNWRGFSDRVITYIPKGCKKYIIAVVWYNGGRNEVSIVAIRGLRHNSALRKMRKAQFDYHKMVEVLGV